MHIPCAGTSPVTSQVDRILDLARLAKAVALFMPDKLAAPVTSDTSANLATWCPPWQPPLPQPQPPPPPLQTGSVQLISTVPHTLLHPASHSGQQLEPPPNSFASILAPRLPPPPLSVHLPGHPSRPWPGPSQPRSPSVRSGAPPTAPARPRDSSKPHLRHTHRARLGCHDTSPTHQRVPTA